MTRRSVDLPQPFGPMSATMPPPGTVEVDAVEDRERAARPGREGEGQVLEGDAAGAVGSRSTSRAGLARGRDRGRVRVARQRSEERRGRRVERQVGLEQPVVDGRELAPGLDPLGDPGHRPDRRRQVRLDADPDRREDRRAEDGRLEDLGDSHPEAGHVGLDAVPERASGRAAADAHLA